VPKPEVAVDIVPVFVSAPASITGLFLIGEPKCLLDEKVTTPWPNLLLGLDEYAL
jgi:hypothetical protein